MPQGFACRPDDRVTDQPYDISPDDELESFGELVKDRDWLPSMWSY